MIEMVEAYILGQISPKREKEALSKIAEINCVNEVDIVYGKYDLIAKVTTDSMEELKNIVREEIRKTGVIELTQTLVVTEV